MNELEELEVMTEKVASEDTTDIQPDWKNSPLLKDLKEDFTEAQSEHSAHVSEVAVWLDRMHITGTAKITTPKGRSAVQPRVIRKQAEWRYPALSSPFLSTKDVFNIYPRSNGDTARADQSTTVLNYQFNHKMNKVKFIDECTRTLVDEGTVFVYTGWKLEEEDYEEEEPIFTIGPVESQQEAMETQQLMQQYQADPETFKINSPDLLVQVVEASMQNQAPMKAFISGHQMVQKTRTIANHPAPEVLDYRSVIPDPTCEGDISKANFMVRLFESSQSELKKAGIYSNLDEISIDSAPSETNDPDASSFTFKDKARAKFEVVEYWGYWDINGDGTTKSIVCSWVNNTMIRLEENPMPGGVLPFESAQQLPRRKSNYGEPDGALIYENQQIIGATVRGSVDLMARAANAQVGSDKAALDPVNRAKMKRGEDYEYNPNSDPMKAFFMHKFPELPQSVGILTQTFQRDAESMTGIQAFTGNGGMSGDALGSTATAVKSATDASSLRNADILRRMGEMIKRIGMKYVAMNALFLEEDEVTRLTNRPYVETRQDDLHGDLDLEIAISTPEEDNAKAQELAFMLQTVGPNVDPKMTFTIMADIATLRNMPDTAARLNDWEPPEPDPMQQQMQQMEVAKIQAEIEEIQSRTQENHANAEYYRARSGTEGAKAGNLKSDTDLKDLNFLEQESGTTQARQKELGRERAGQVAEDKVFDHMAKSAQAEQADTIKQKQSAVGNPTVSTGLSQV